MEMESKQLNWILSRNKYIINYYMKHKICMLLFVRRNKETIHTSKEALFCCLKLDLTRIALSHN